VFKIKGKSAGSNDSFEYSEQMGIKLASRALFHVPDRQIRGHSFSIRTIGSHCVKAVRYCDHSRLQRDLIGCDTVRIPIAVIPFVMMPDPGYYIP